MNKEWKITGVTYYTFDECADFCYETWLKISHFSQTPILNNDGHLKRKERKHTMK